MPRTLEGLDKFVDWDVDQSEGRDEDNVIRGYPKDEYCILFDDRIVLDLEKIDGRLFVSTPVGRDDITYDETSVLSIEIFKVVNW